MKQFFFCFLFLIGCTSRPREIPPLEVFGMLSNDFAILIDTNESTYESAENAISIPAKKFFTDDPAVKKLLSQTPRDKTLVFYGDQSQKVAEYLAQKGRKCGYFQNLNQWKNAKLPLTLKK